MNMKNTCQYSKQINSRGLLLLLCAVVLLLAVVMPGCSLSSSTDDLGLIIIEEEVAAPDFSLPTLSSTVTLSELQGMPVILNFWYIGCAPCIVELPYLNAASTEYSGKLTIITINVKDSTDDIREFFNDNEHRFIAAIDLDNQVAPAYGIRFTPTTYFIDSSGIIRYAKLGAFTNEKYLMESIDKLLEED
jgi:thiol-disulfide isomerase/thioredoxin